MAITIFKIKKWSKMILGKSALHVNQGEGKCYKIDEIGGYYNDLTEKVLLYGVPNGQVPSYPNEKGVLIEFSIGIFQYGLACYDLYLLKNDATMLTNALVCGDWAVTHQEDNGSWDTFGKELPNAPFSSMAQGEAISLLSRLYIATKNETYLNAARKAYQYLCTTKNEGGVCEYHNDLMYLYEFTDRPIVFNGAIFSYWGIRDFYLLTKDNEVKNKMEMAEKGLISIINKMDNGYWSKYDNGKKIASPFYHRLHIAQLQAMYKLTGNEIYSRLALKFDRYQSSKVKKLRSFIQKMWQKIVE